MINDFELEQAIVVKTLVSQNEKDHFSHAYLIEGNNYSNSILLAKSMAKFFLCRKKHNSVEEEINCRTCSQFNNNSSLDFYLIDIDGLTIKKEEINLLQSFFKTKSLNKSKRVYIINNCDRMNDSSSNALLKFLEEPEEDIIAILVTNNITLLKPTIISRCQVFRLRPNIIQENVNIDETVIKFLSVIEKNGTRAINEKKLLISSKDKNEILCKFDAIIDFYRNELTDSEDIINSNNRVDDIIRKIKLTILTKEQIKGNANLDMVIDKYIIEMSGGLK